MEKKASLLTFPCPYTLKIVGHSHVDFERKILSLAQQHCGEQSVFKTALKSSQNQKYTSLSLTFEAQSQTELDSLYRALSADPDIVFVL